MGNQDDNILEKYFNSIKEENYKETFNDVESWLRKESVLSNLKPKKSKFAFFKYIFSEGRLKYAYLFVILIFAGFASNFSVTRTETIGSIMSWSVDKQRSDVIKKIDNLDWIDKSQLVVDQQNSDGKEILTYKILLPTSNTEEVEQLKEKLASIKDIQSINVIPISEPVKQPIYAIALEKFFKYDYDKNYVNPEEIKDNIYEQLKLAGIQNYAGFVNTGSGGTGKFLNVNFGAQPDSVRIKVHTDIVNEYDLDEELDEMDELLEPVKVINDSVIKNIIVRINGEKMNTDVIMSEVQRNLDTLHLKLKCSVSKRKERMERFKEKMEKFNEKMEKLNERMEKYNERMEKYNERMEKYNEKIEKLKEIPRIDFDYDVDDDGNVDVDVNVEEVPEVPEIPEIPEVPDMDNSNFNFNFDFGDLNKLNFRIDSLKFNFDGEKMEKANKKLEKKMEKANKKLEKKMKKVELKLKNNKHNYDSSRIKIDIDYDDDDDDDSE
jgi:hypothetical protein